MKKNYVFIVCLLLIGCVMSSWTTVATTAKLIIPDSYINYVELYSPEIESLVEIPIQLFGLEKVENDSSLSFLSNSCPKIS